MLVQLVLDVHEDLNVEKNLTHVVKLNLMKNVVLLYGEDDEVDEVFVCVVELNYKVKKLTFLTCEFVVVLVLKALIYLVHLKIFF